MGKGGYGGRGLEGRVAVWGLGARYEVPPYWSRNRKRRAWPSALHSVRCTACTVQRLASPLVACYRTVSCERGVVRVGVRGATHTDPHRPTPTRGSLSAGRTIHCSSRSSPASSTVSRSTCGKGARRHRSPRPRLRRQRRLLPAAGDAAAAAGRAKAATAATARWTARAMGSLGADRSPPAPMETTMRARETTMAAVGTATARLPRGAGCAAAAPQGPPPPHRSPRRLWRQRCGEGGTAVGPRDEAAGDSN